MNQQDFYSTFCVDDAEGETWDTDINFLLISTLMSTKRLETIKRGSDFVRNDKVIRLYRQVQSNKNVLIVIILAWN